ncbi:MAG: TRAP transporter small permease subunit [Rhodobacterales bacterium]|nr:TRAP transporter small permease subunit [Rhodobacterales bacterium]MDX5500216.1 TRAP transporter small permease subunit [Rhodobacterales bacterium]
MNALLALSRGIDRVNELFGKVVMWAILVAILISAANALVRKIFSTSSNAWLEAQWYLFGASFLLAAAYTLKQNEHIRIDIVYGLFGRRVQHWIDLLGHLLFLLPFSVLMVYYLWPYTMKSVISGEMSSNAGGLIIWPAKALLLVGFILLTIQAISEIIKKIAVMRGDIEDPTPFQSSHDTATTEAELLMGEMKK